MKLTNLIYQIINKTYTSQASSVIKVIDWLATGWSAGSIFPAGTFISLPGQLWKTRCLMQSVSGALSLRLMLAEPAYYLTHPFCAEI
jgi:hypothetical protein